MEETDERQGLRNQRIRDLIGIGSEIAGGAVGGALGFLAGGPTGAAMLGAGGVAAAKTLTYIGSEVSERLLGPREKVRIGGVLAVAASEISQRISNGEKIRDDGFFEEKVQGRSDANEVIESILLKSQREPEEKKIVYMGHLFASIAFDSRTSPEMAHQIAKAAEQLTYRQLCILRLSVHKSGFELQEGDYRGQGSFSRELYQVLYECLDLYNRGFINLGGDVAFGPTDVKPGNMTLPCDSTVHNDSYEQYESPSLIWILSEAVVEQVLNNDDFNKINPYHKGENAYSCFYNMMIDEKPLYDHLDTMYKNNSIDKFMEESYQFMIENEEEIRSQMPNRGSY
ncbi:MAG: hypothetical protein ACOX57_08985 [Limnochordia bacterium]